MLPLLVESELTICIMLGKKYNPLTGAYYRYTANISFSISDQNTDWLLKSALHG